MIGFIKYQYSDMLLWEICIIRVEDARLSNHNADPVKYDNLTIAFLSQFGNLVI